MYVITDTVQQETSLCMAAGRRAEGRLRGEPGRLQMALVRQREREGPRPGLLRRLWHHRLGSSLQPALLFLSRRRPSS